MCRRQKWRWCVQNCGDSYCCWSLLYDTILCYRADSLRSYRMWLWMSDCRLSIARFGISTKVVYFGAVWLLHGWWHVELLPSLHTFCVHHTTTHQFYCDFMQSHIRMVHVFLTNLPPAPATAVTRGWNGYRMSQHRKLTVQKKIPPLLLPGLKPATFQSPVWCPNSNQTHKQF